MPIAFNDMKIIYTIACVILVSSQILFIRKIETIFPLFAKDRGKEITNKLKDEVTKLYPWLIRRNCLANYFTREMNPEVGKLWPLDQTYGYKNCTIVFVHNQKSGGTTTKTCLFDSMKDVGERRPRSISNINANLFFSNIMNGVDDYLGSSYHGDSTFAVCDFTARPCAYFTVVREPIERAISSYNMCRGEKQPQCVMRDIKQMTVNEWAIHQGSIFFRQLVANPAFFTDKYTDLVQKLRGPDDPPTELIYPWWRNKLILDYLMDDNQKNMVLDYVLLNLESWFAVIGLTNEYDTNFRLFERVFKLPFYKLCYGRKENERFYDCGMRGNDPNATKDIIVNKLRHQLSSDAAVMKALHFDIQIYKKVQEIFRRQKIAFF